ncbi:hypothetical protein STANM309S_00815 [Streptomyces tanashiensis]
MQAHVPGARLRSSGAGHRREIRRPPKSPGQNVRAAKRAANTQFRAGVDDDLHVRREPVLARGRPRLPVSDRDQGAVHDPQPLEGVGRTGGRLDSEQRPQPLDHRNTVAGARPSPTPPAEPRPPPSTWPRSSLKRNRNTTPRRRKQGARDRKHEPSKVIQVRDRTRPAWEVPHVRQPPPLPPPSPWRAALYLSAALLMSGTAGCCAFGGKDLTDLGREESSSLGAAGTEPDAALSRAMDLPWPTEGQASAEVEGVGSLGDQANRHRCRSPASPRS